MGANQPYLNLQVTGAGQVVSTQEVQSLMNRIQNAVNGLFSTVAGNPWNNPNIPTTEEAAVLAALTAETPLQSAAVLDRLIFLRPLDANGTIGVACDSQGEPVIRRLPTD